MAAHCSLVQKTCLKSSFSLRTQLLLSFGSSALISLLIVVILACTSVFSAGRTVKQSSNDLMREQVKENLLKSTHLFAEKMTAHMDGFEGTVQLIAEAVMDRIVGYPNDGWEMDEHVPFKDSLTQQYAYPLRVTPPPMDWDIRLNINKTNRQEHLPGRAHCWEGLPVSSASSSFFLQGACDPSVTDPSAPAFYPDCTSENNDFEAGGRVQPTNESKWLREKSGDLGVFLKALFESQEEAFLTGIYFKNAGAGATLQYPGHTRLGHLPPYESVGCDWMREINPHTDRPFGTEEEIGRCHPAGTLVHLREYNPMEREWCRKFALAGGEIAWHGPFFAAGQAYLPLLAVGKGVFDRRTGEFIGCVALDIHTDEVGAQLASAVLDEKAHIALVHYDSGELVQDTLGSPVATTSQTVSGVNSHLTDSESVKYFKNAMNFDEPWTPEQVEDALQSHTMRTPHGLMTAQPLPMLPDEYNPLYRPKFLAMQVVSDEIFQVVQDMEDSIDQDMLCLALLAVGLGVAGMLVLLATVWCVARMLTQPLNWIESLAFQIVNHNNKAPNDDAPLLADDFDDSSATLRWTPRTEINELVSEFREMIAGFSGSGAARVAELSLVEVRNALTWCSDYHQLYSWEKSKLYTGASSFNGDSDAEETSAVESSSELARGVLVLPAHDGSSRQFEGSSQLIVPPPRRRNRGSVIGCLGNSLAKNTINEEDEKKRVAHPIQSKLFWWIIVLIVIPMLVANGIICGIVSHQIVTLIPSWVDELEAASNNLEKSSLSIVANAKASLMRSIVFEAVRDLHLFTRFAGWISFGGINKSESFTEMIGLTEECKESPYGECPLIEERTPCPCDWQDNHRHRSCVSVNDTYSRNLQVGFYSVQANDADPVTGARTESRYPDSEYSPSATFWVNNVSSVPGAEKGEQSVGYATTYDRLRTAATLPVAALPTYNYATTLRREKHQLTIALAFDLDGLFSGFAGCNDAPSGLAQWQASEGNGAHLVAPDLCPLGKWGYDPRCRGWYQDGKKRYLSSNSPVHVTAPYTFAIENETAASATSPLSNPASGEYIGQALLDFYPVGLRRSLKRLKDRKSILITPEVDSSGGDTVVGPDKSADWESVAVGQLLFPGEANVLNRQTFENGVLADMKNGSVGTAHFERLRDDGATETIFISFAPVTKRVLLPLSPHDFSGGVSTSEQLFYSVGIFEEEGLLYSPFRTIEGEVDQQLNTKIAIYIAVVVAVSALFLIFTSIVTLYVTTPMILLLDIVRSINDGSIQYDLPKLQGGSREVQRVYNTFVKLYKVMRISNTQFFSRNLSWAHHFMSDALDLFRKVGDRKAIGIACNNVGNTLFAMAQLDDLADEGGCVDNSCAVCEALRRYGEAIEIAQRDFDALSPDNEQKADFALQLSDRLFNRGLFLLHIAASECTRECVPEDAKDQGFTDIARAKDLDLDSKEAWLDSKLLLKNSTKYFARLIRRINGLASLHDHFTGVQQVWDAKELVDDADQLLFAAWNQPSAPLFKEVTRVGRLQQLEGAAIRLTTKMGNKVEAAKLAMRMLSEDDHILEVPFVLAAEALLALTRSSSDDEEQVVLSRRTIECARRDLRDMTKNCKNATLSLGKCLVFTVELCERWEGDPLLDKVNVNSLRLYDRHCTADDYVAVITYGGTDNLAPVDLSIKEKNEGRQRALLDMATQTTAERANAAFPTAFQMLVDAQASSDRDCFMLILMDGYAWDVDACWSIKSRIERLNSERDTLIHIFVIGLDVEDEDARMQCQSLCTVTKLSFYVDATLETIDDAFKTATRAMAGRSAADTSLEGITMEKF